MELERLRPLLIHSVEIRFAVERLLGLRQTQKMSDRAHCGLSTGVKMSVL